MTQIPRSYGTWPSPISAHFVAGKALRLDQLEANMTARINNMAKELSTLPPKPAPEAVQKAETPKQVPTAKKETEAKRSGRDPDA